MRAPLSWRLADANSVSIVKVDLPDPDTPVMQVKVPSGMLAVTSFRLFARAPVTVSFLPDPLRRVSGKGPSGGR
jgi:hypothetical protein